MEPHKFEEDIKDKLEKRTIRPSADAWNQLESRLDISPNQHKNKPFIWLGIAASVVGVFLVVSQFFNENHIESNTPSVVATPEVVKQDKPNQVVVETANETKDNKISEKPDSELKGNPIAVKPVIKVAPKEQQEIASANNEVLKSDINSEANNIKPIELNQKALSFEDQKIQDVVAQVQSLKDKNITVTNEEVESLLQQAQKEIRQRQMYDENLGVVDARLLLEDVEADLEKSFRDKAFEALKANFNFIKTAVARRND